MTRFDRCLLGLTILLLLHNCETRRSAQISTEQLESAARPTPVAAATRPAGLDATDLTRRYGRWPGLTDSLAAIGHQHLRSPGGPAYSDAAYSDAADCDPRISPSGRAVLICSEVLRAGQPRLKLIRPHAQLRAARFLGDTTLLVVYEYGDYVARPAAPPGPAPTAHAPRPAADESETATVADYELVSTPAQRGLPTARLLSTSGRVLRQFRLAAAGGLAYELPRLWVKPAGAYVFFEEMHKLVIIPKAHPDSLVELRTRQLPRFKAPRRPREKRYDFRSDFTCLRLYIDTLRPQQVAGAAAANVRRLERGSG